MSRITAVVLMLCCVLVAGCSSKRKEPQPLELERFAAELSLKTEWSTRVGNGQGKLWNNLRPAVFGDTIYAADATGVVVAHERFSGKRLWRKKLKLTISGGVGVGGNMVVLGSLAGDVVALERSTGDELWRVNIQREVLSAPAANDELVIVQTQDDRLIALDAASGAQLWEYTGSTSLLTLRGSSAPLLTRDLVFAGLSSGRVVAIELQHGLPIWEQRVAMPGGRTELERLVDIDGELLLRNNVLYVAAYQGKMAGLDADTGRILWQRDASSYAGLAQGFGNAYVSLVDGVVEGVDERSSTVMWTNQKLLRRQPSAPAVISSNVAVGDLEGYVHLLSQVDGRFVARKRLDKKGIRVQPLVVGNWMYVFGNSGKLVALTIN